MDKLTPKQLSGIGEDLAANYLISKGYNVLCKNFRSECGEIDLIVRRDDLLIFVEVKTRSKHSINLALMNVGYQKQKRISLTAQRYITQNQEFVNFSFRFDVVVVLYYAAEQNFRVLHYEDAFRPVDI